MPARPPVAPMITCQDVDKTYEYFTSVLGFAGNGKMPGPDGSTMHAEVFLPTAAGDARIMLGPYAMAASSPESGEFGQNLPKGPLGNGVILYLHHPNVDKLHTFLQARGAMIHQAPKDQFWGDRTLDVRTPDGYFLTFAQPIKGFKWPKEQLASITGGAKPTAPGTKKGVKVQGLPKKAAKAAAKKGR